MFFKKLGQNKTLDERNVITKIIMLKTFVKYISRFTHCLNPFLILFFLVNPIHCEGKDLKVALKWKHQFQFAGIYAAIEDGIYRQYGLNVTTIEPTLGLNSVDMVKFGKCDIGISSTSIIRHLNDVTNQLVIIGATFLRSPAILIVSDSINSANDLLNSKLMLEKDSDEVKLMLLSLGVFLNYENIIEHDYTITPLANKEVVGMSAYLTDEPYELGRMNYSYNVFDPTNYGIDTFGDILFTKKSFLYKYPDHINNFIQATQKGWKIAISQRERLANIIIQKYQSTHKKEHLLYEAEMITNFIRPGNIISTKGKIDIEIHNVSKWKNLEAIYKKFRLVDYDFNIFDHLLGFSGLGIDISKKCSSALALPYLFLSLGLMVILVITERLSKVKIIVRFVS